MEKRPLLSSSAPEKSGIINDNNEDDQSILSDNFSVSWGSWWSRNSFYLLPVEVVTFLYLFAVYFNFELYQQYYYQRVFTDIIANWTNETPNASCLTQDYIVNQTTPDTFVAGQKVINQLGMFTSLAYLIPSILVSPLIGTLSDQVGRKPSIIFVFVGQLMSVVVGIFIVYFKLSLYYFFIGSVLNGFSGGFGIIFSSSFAYVTDVTPKKWLTIRMAILEASLFVAIAGSSASADTWMQKTDCSFRPQVWLILATVLCGILYASIIPESLNPDKKIKSVSDYQCGFHRLFTGCRLYFLPSYIGVDLWKIWIVVAVTVVSVINETGNVQIQSYFLYNKPLEWTYTRIGIYLAVTSVSHLVGLVVVLPIFVMCKLPDSMIALIGVVVSFGMSVYTALLTTTYEMFSVGVIIGLQSIVVPSVRSILAKHLREEDRGAAFSVLTVFQLLANVISTVAFNEAYTPEDLYNGRDNPRVVYWMSAGIWGMAIPLLVILVIPDLLKPLKNFRSKIISTVS